MTSSSAIEIKATNKNTIPENALQPHQKRALLAAKGCGMTHKIADNRTRLPFDAFFLKNANAYVIACFTKKGICLGFDINNWQGCNINTEAEFYINI